MSDGLHRAPDTGAETLSGGVSAADYKALLKNRDFRNLSLATVTSALGDWIGVLAILALTVEIMGPTRAAPFALGAVMAARVVPAMLLGPIAGVFVDRWNRKRVLIWADIGRGVVMALIPFTDELLTLLLATLVIEVLSALFAPAKDAVFPRLVRRDQLVAANQINLIVTYGTLPLGGVLYAAMVGFALAVAPEGSFFANRPIAFPIWFNAASYLISAPLLARLRVPVDPRRHMAPDPAEPVGAWAQLKEGLAFVASHPVIRALIVGVMIAFVAAGVVMSLGELFARILNAGPSGFGMLVASVGGGLLVGLVLTGPLTARIAKERLFAPGIGLAGVGLIATALMPRLDLACVTGAVMGMGAGVSFIVGYTVLQERTVDSLRGRTFAAFHSGVRVAILGATVAAPLLVGILGIERRTVEPPAGSAVLYPYQVGGVRLTLVLAGLIALAGAVLAGRWLRRSLDDADGLDLGSTGHGHERRRGHLIVFEGGDGAGKSTQIRLLRSAVERAGHDVLVTREPGGTKLGEDLRRLLLEAREEGFSDRAEALLYAAARAQHVEEVLVPALARGTVVLCDRYVDSSVVYQGVARGLGDAQVAELNRWATGTLRPDLVVLLDVDARIGLERLEGEADRLESAGLAFHRRVNSAFRHLAELDPDRYLVVDASGPVEEIQGRIRDVVLPLLRRPAHPAGGPSVADAGGQDVAGGVPAGSPPSGDEPAPRLPRTEELRGDLAGQRSNPSPGDEVPTTELAVDAGDEREGEVPTTELPTEPTTEPGRDRG
jgi:dTMP kinase